MHFYNKIAKVFFFFFPLPPPPPTPPPIFFFLSFFSLSPGFSVHPGNAATATVAVLFSSLAGPATRYMQSPVTTVSTLSPSLNAPSSSLLEVYILQFQVEYAVLNNLMYMLSFCFIILRVSLSSLSNKSNILFIMFASLSRDFS